MAHYAPRMTSIKPYLHLRYLLIPLSPLFAAVMAARCVYRRSIVAEAPSEFIQSYRWWICASVGGLIRRDAGWYRKWTAVRSCGPWKWHWRNPGGAWSKALNGATWPVE